jgi:hypothetical protein
MRHMTKWKSFLFLTPTVNDLLYRTEKLAVGSQHFLLLIVVAPLIDGQVASICIGECVLFDSIFASLSGH